MVNEIVLRKQDIDENIKSVYFGGGTPSIIDGPELEVLIENVYKYYSIDEDIEITLEANPDDISKEKLLLWKSLGINRLSIGIQTFNDHLLKFLNRAHDSHEALSSLTFASQQFNNLNLDIIYSIPGSSNEILREDLDKFMSFNPTHISAYNLTIEDKTVFGRWKEKGKIDEVSEDFAVQQYDILTSCLNKNGYEHYEVSNFCKPGSYSRHNSSYWKDTAYLGFGPGAHSYINGKRAINISSNPKYIRSIEQGVLPRNTEELSMEDRYNEYLLTRLRTKWGIDFAYVKSQFSRDLEESDLVKKLLTSSLAKFEGQQFILTEKGLLMADTIALNLSLYEPKA